MEINRRILIVDDHESIHADFRKLLCPESRPAHDLKQQMVQLEADLFGMDRNEPPPVPQPRYELDSAFQAAEGLEMIHEAEQTGRPYAMVFVDVRMPPGMDGVKLIEMAWDRYPELEFVICTAYSDYSWEDLARKFGDKERLLFVRKPFDRMTIRQIAAALTRKWSSERALRSSRDELQELSNVQKHDLLETQNRLKDKQRLLEETNRHLRNLLRQNEIAIWNEDFFEARKALLKLKVPDEDALKTMLSRNDYGEARRIAGLVKVANVDKATLDLFGAEAPQRYEGRLDKIMNPAYLPAFVDELCAIWKGESSFYVETVHRTEQKGEVHVALSMSLPDLEEGWRRVPVSVVDITARKNAEALLRQEAGLDPLTGLPNRRLFMERLSEALRQGAKRGARLAVLFIDLDKFKPINDTLGHVVGDQALRMAAERLSACLRGSDMVARYGGDEFTVMLQRQRDAYDPKKPAEKICSEMATPFEIGDHAVQLAASVGIALYPEDADTPLALVSCADAAMYRAKERGGGAPCFFREEMNRALLRRTQNRTRLLTAIEQDDFQVWWQPVVDLATREWVGVEALLRWSDAGGATLAARQVLPQAEQAGLLDEVDAWAFRQACREIADLKERDLLPSRIFINLSGALCRKPDFAQRAVEMMAATGAPAETFVIDLAEAVFMEEPRFLENGAEALRLSGVTLAVDDFGARHASARTLTRFPLSTVKLEPELTRNHQLGDLAASLIELARRRELHIIAKGVETEEQAERARELGVDAAQGHLYSEPMSLADLIHALDRV